MSERVAGRGQSGSVGREDHRPAYRQKRDGRRRPRETSDPPSGGKSRGSQLAALRRPASGPALAISPKKGRDHDREARRRPGRDARCGRSPGVSIENGPTPPLRPEAGETVRPPSACSALDPCRRLLEAGSSAGARLTYAVRRGGPDLLLGPTVPGRWRKPSFITFRRRRPMPAVRHLFYRGWGAGLLSAR